ncbi:unnamed protein product [Peronospora belbahrii]|uniref:Uncharacterized protein n=1 Tax=Peronospora belbahrii TaxID=622444 RepID=A0AAU9LBB5_9STRA|nr:unnamed protein product [Peronospora belbahrii]CAH0522301.1 unnamed protein product [Peronospora belbahrii]
MSRYNSGIAAEFFKLELLLMQTANDAVKCMEILKTNLSDYDIYHDLNYIHTSTSFMRDSIHFAEHAALELSLVAEQIAKSKSLSDWEIAAARNKMSAASDAMSGLKKVARVYDEMNGKSTGIARFIDHVLIRKYDTKKTISEHNNMPPECADTVEIVVKSTLRNAFNGFSALKHQISTAEKSLLPSLVQRAKDVVETVVIKIKGDANPPRSATM